MRLCICISYVDKLCLDATVCIYIYMLYIYICICWLCVYAYVAAYMLLVCSMCIVCDSGHMRCICIYVAGMQHAVVSGMHVSMVATYVGYDELCVVRVYAHQRVQQLVMYVRYVNEIGSYMGSYSYINSLWRYAYVQLRYARLVRMSRFAYVDELCVYIYICGLGIYGLYISYVCMYQCNAVSYVSYGLCLSRATGAIDERCQRSMTCMSTMSDGVSWWCHMTTVQSTVSTSS